MDQCEKVSGSWSLPPPAPCPAEHHIQVKVIGGEDSEQALEKKLVMRLTVPPPGSRHTHTVSFGLVVARVMCS